MAVEVFSNPGREKALALVRRGIRESRTLLISGRCRVRYEGRASSFLDWGDRILIIKEDGAFIVHRPFGYEPVNWQPQKSYTDTRIEDDVLVIRSVRGRPHEVLKVYLKDVYLLAILKLVDKAAFLKYGEEEDLRRAILSYPELVERGLRVLEVERRTRFGFIDILCEDSQGRLVVIELKKDAVGKSAVYQLKNYIEALKRELGRRDIRGIIVAPRLAKGVEPLLKIQGLEFKPLDLRKATGLLRGEKILDYI